MHELEKLKNVLLDLNKNQMRFSTQLGEFEALQAKISTLQKRAGMDPEAARKLRQFDDFMAQQAPQTQHQIMAHVEAFEGNLAKIREQLGALTVPEPESQGGVARVSTSPAKTRNRNFG